MRLELNTKKQTFFNFFNKFTLTDDSPDREIDPASLSITERKSLIYNIQRGVLLGDLSSLTTQEPPPPVQQQAINAIEARTANIENILTKSINSIKKELFSLSIKEVKYLLSVEEAGKKRKAVISFCKELIQKHSKGVTEIVSGAETNAPHITEFFSGAPEVKLDNVEDVVESNIETIEIQLPSKDS